MNQLLENNTDRNYEKAKQDVLQAAKSIDELTPQQREQLARELFGVKAVITMCHIMQQYFSDVGENRK